MPGTITATWTGSYARNPVAYVAGPPSLLPLAIPVTNTAGQWLFAVVSWRQDAGTAGLLQYPSTVNVNDDAGNFWIPVQPGQHNTGIVRTAIWMAPAARAAEFVFVSPTSTAAGDAYQSAITALIIEVTADVPWYSVAATAFTSTNQGGSITLSQAPASGLFTIGAIAWDNTGGAVTPTATGWTALPTVNATNNTNHAGDMQQDAWYATTTGSTMTLSASGTPTMDWAEVIITVHGVTDAIPFPYATPLENWPAVIIEAAAGPVLNVNPAMVNSAANWTAQNGAVTAVPWPVYEPWPQYQNLVTPSLALTPSGSANFAAVISELEPVSTSARYTTVAFVYSVAGWASCIAQINWYDSGASYISTSGPAGGASVPPGTWTQLPFGNGIFPPSNAAFGQAVVAARSLTYPAGTVPSSAVLYVGYAAFGVGDSYENVPLDDVVWTDLSPRNFTQGALSINRGIQYEQQSLEAGTMTVFLDNNDGAMMFGNLLSAFWPTIGDTDVPIRVRAVWPLSTTPYYTLFTGFTDQVQFGWDEATRHGYAEFEASDAWSRLTSQMLNAQNQEILEDSPVVFCTCSLSGTNIALANNTAVVTSPSIYGAGGATASFTSTFISQPGAPGQSCWQSTAVPTAAPGLQGVALTYFPGASQPLPVVSGGVTVTFWMSPTLVTGSQPVTNLTVCTCWSGQGPMWTISISNNSGAPGSTATITTYHRNTGAATNTSIGTNTYLGPINSQLSYQFAVTFTQTSLTVVVNPGDVTQNTVTVSGLSLAATAIGFSFGGNAGPLFASNLGGTGGFMNIAIADFAVFAGIIPPARIAAQHQTALTAWPNELDTARLARVAGYAGATPAVLAMRGLDLPSPPAADVDPVTAVTDTNGQVTSGYFTNIAASTLAFMFVNGAGALVYRRRLEAYNRSISQWVTGDSPSVPLNPNTLDQSASVAGWTAQNGATLTSSALAAAGPYFFPFAGLFHGDGVTGNPQILSGSLASTPVTPGLWYALSLLAYSPQGFGDGSTTGFKVFLQFWTSGGSFISQLITGPLVTPAASPLWVSVPPFQAPATAGYAQIVVQTLGVPASSVQFYVARVWLITVPAVKAGGPGAVAPEVPYMVDSKLSSDRAILFNQAVLTQFGTGTVTNFRDTSLVFAPTSGVLVTIQNTPSVTARAGVPYTATLYLDNTVQALPYVLSEPSMEDFGNWVTQTLGGPLLRPDQVTITPAATNQATQMALQADVGDTATFRRRPLGAPAIHDLTYISKLSHDIDIGQGRWNTKYELSPFPQGTVLACDDVLHGTLTGGNYFAW